MVWLDCRNKYFLICPAQIGVTVKLVVIHAKQKRKSMKKITALMLLTVVLISLNSCRKVIGDGPVVTESRNTAEYSEIEFDVPGDLVFVESDHYEISIEAQRNIINVIDTYVSGDELKVKVRNNTIIRSSEDILITIKAPSVSSLVVSGSGTLNVLNLFTPLHAKLRVSGSGRIVINKVITDALDATISGSGSIEVLDGEATKEDISISGSGNVNLLPVMAKKATTHTSGSGNIKVQVQNELNVRISGSGDVFYKGNPEMDVNISGSGRIIRL